MIRNLGASELLKTLYIVVFFSLSASSSEFCQKAITKVIGNHEAELDAHLEKAFDAYMKKKLAKLPRVKKEAVEKALAQMTYRHGYVVGPSSYFGYVEPANLPFFISPLYLNSFLEKHPMSKITLVHELQHIEDLASGWHPGRSASSIIEENLKKGTLKKMEERAFGAQYDFIRDTFSKEDFLALKKYIDSNAGAQDATLTFKMVNLPHGLPKDCVDILFCGKEREKALQATKQMLDARFIENIDSALNQTRKEYVERHLSSNTYQNLFASHDAAVDSLKKVLPFHAFLISIATLGGAFSIKQWMEQEPPAPRNIRPSMRPQ